MKLLARILAVVAGVGAVAGAAFWAKNNVTFSVRKMTEEEQAEEEARVAEAEAEVDAETAAEVEAAGDDAVVKTMARIKGWVRKLGAGVQITRGEEEEHTEGSQTPEDGAAEPQFDVPAPEDTGPNLNPVEAAPTQAPLDEDGRLDATKLAAPEDFADWDDLGCQG